MTKMLIVIALFSVFMLSLGDIVQAQENWCYIKEKGEALLNSTPRTFDECSEWLKKERALEISYTQAINWSGTAIGLECMDEAKRIFSKVRDMVERVKDLEIDYVTKDLPPNSKAIIRYVLKEMRRPEKLMLIIVGGSSTLKTGDMVFNIGSLLGVAEERLGILEEDGIISSKKASQGKNLVRIAKAGNSLISLSDVLSKEIIATEFIKVGLEVDNIVKTTEGYFFNAKSNGVSQSVEIQLPYKKISITFPQIKIADNSVENISGTLSLTQNDLKNGEVEIRGRIDDGANGANTQRVQIDVGDGWRDVQGRVNWKYSFKPRENQKYNLRFKAIDLENKEHESLFTPSLICQAQQRGEDDEAIIRQLIYDWEEAYVNEDLNKYMSYYADDYWDETDHWDKETKRITEDRDFKRYEPVGEKKIKSLKITMQGNDKALARVNFYLIRTISATGLQSIDDNLTDVYLEKRNGRWLVVRERFHPSVDNTAPRVVSTTPANGATGVSTTTSIVIRFNEPMGAYQIFGFSGGGANSDYYTFSSYNKNTYTFTFSNVTPLQSGETYTVQVQESFRDAYGNSVQTTSFSFTTQ